MSTTISTTPWPRRWLRLLGIAALLLAAFTFNWQGTPAAPLPWTPGAVNDWDLLATNDMPSYVAGTMNAQHGADCSPPPATHVIRNLTDSAFICNNHFMTAIYGAGDAPKTYAAVYFTPAQMVDMSAGTATVSWHVSTQRQSNRDWWDLWLTPFSENLVVPLQNLPAFNGPPKDALHVQVDNGTCGTVGAFTIVRMIEYRNFQQVFTADNGTNGLCVEDQVGISAVQRAAFQLDVSQSYARLSMPATGAVLADEFVNLASPLAVATWGHHSYDPDKDIGSSPNTWHWSDIGISPAVPFTMLRPCGTCVLNSGTGNSVTLPQPAPARAFLRFAALGAISVSLNGGAFQPAVLQLQDGPMSDGVLHDEQNKSYFMPIPAGTTTVAFQGVPIGGQLDWWVSDVSVWAS